MLLFFSFFELVLVCLRVWLLHVRDGACANVLVESDLLGRANVRAHKGAAKHVLHGLLHLAVIANQRESDFDIVLTDQLLGLGHHLGANRASSNLVQRNNRHSTLQLTLFLQIKGRGEE